MAIDIDNTTKNDRYVDLCSSELAEISVLRGEGRFASTGALVVETGPSTSLSTALCLMRFGIEFKCT
jgi:ATP-dependent phosphoenolpyruvate carboxykinase